MKIRCFVGLHCWHGKGEVDFRVDGPEFHGQHVPHTYFSTTERRWLHVCCYCSKLKYEKPK